MIWHPILAFYFPPLASWVAEDDCFLNNRLLDFPLLEIWAKKFHPFSDNNYHRKDVVLENLSPNRLKICKIRIY